MAAGKRQRSGFAERSHAICDADLRHKLEPHEHGGYPALEVETGDYEIADSFGGANEKLRKRHPLPVKFPFSEIARSFKDPAMTSFLAMTNRVRVRASFRWARPAVVSSNR